MKEEENIIVSLPKKKKSKKGFLLLLVVLSCVFILGGVYFYVIGNPKRIMAQAIDKFSNEIKDVIDLEEFAVKNENFTMVSDIDIHVQSDYISYLASFDPTYQPYLNMLTNLSLLNTEVKVIQNVENKQFLATIHSGLKGANFVDYRYLIQENKSYYFLQDFLSSYIYVGDNSYFDDLDSYSSQQDDIYLYDFIINSFKNNLKDSYFKKQIDTITIDGKQQKVTKIIFTVDNQVVKEIATNILEDLKSDKKATEILGAYYNDIENTITEEAFFEGDSNIQIVITTDSFLYKVKRYEFIYNDDTSDCFTIRYEKQQGNGLLELYINDEKLGMAVIEEKEDVATIHFYNESREAIGVMTISEINDTNSIVFQMEIEGVIFSIQLDIKTEDDEKETIDTTFRFDISSNDIVFLNIELNVATIKEDMEVIQEDISTAIDTTTLTEEQQEILQQKAVDFLAALMEANHQVSV